MKYFLLMTFLCCFGQAAWSQNNFTAIIKSGEDQQPLPGATVTWKEGKLTIVADSAGIVLFTAVPDGRQTFLVSHAGYETRSVIKQFPVERTMAEEIIMEAMHEEETEVIVRATRTGRSIANTPTRTEVINGEELSEKANMKPGDIRMVLSESTGIQVQQTSATSFNAGIRIQGLDGRYTQILRDGYPSYAGFSGGLSILQTAPLDLKQVEIIKGSASTLYGGGAIAGLVNLVSKTPLKEPELNFLLNATSAGGLDMSSFYSRRFDRTGLTVFASRNSSAAYDPADIGLSAIPQVERYTINPRLFLYGKKTTADIGISYITENRTGGDMEYIKNGGDGYFEKNNTDRIITQMGIAHRMNERSTLQFKNSYSRFDRSISVPGYRFTALQQSVFNEFTWNHVNDKTDWVIGVNFLSDDLRDKKDNNDPILDYRLNTYGVFVQNAWTLSDKVTMESGLRGDYVNDYGFEFLPRVSLMYRISPKLTTRAGGGLGYKTPTVFTEESERIQFQHLLPVDIVRTKNERSVGGNWDINYRANFGKVGFAFNHLFFYTRLNRALVLVETPDDRLEFSNANGHFDTRGMETNLKLTYLDFKLFLGYTYTDANTHFDGEAKWLPLTARHRLNHVLMYEKEDKLKIGLEAYYFSKQRLNDGTYGRSYWITGVMVEKLWDQFSVYINFENFTDTRQTKFGSIYTGSISNPVFKDIYAPLDGFVVNGGIKLKL